MGVGWGIILNLSPPVHYIWYCNTLYYVQMFIYPVTASLFLLCLKISWVLCKKIRVKVMSVENGVIELHVPIQPFYSV